MADLPELKFNVRGLPVSSAPPALRSILDSCDGAVEVSPGEPGPEHWALFRYGEPLGTYQLLDEEEY